MNRDQLLARVASHGLRVAPQGGDPFAEATSLEEAEHQRRLAQRMTGLAQLRIIWGDTLQNVTVKEANAMRSRKRGERGVRSCEQCGDQLDKAIKRITTKDGRKVCPTCWTTSHPSRGELPA